MAHQHTNFCDCPRTLTPEQRNDIIEWAMDCQWGDIESREDLEELSDITLIRAIEEYYGGGMAQFIEDSPITIWSL